ncbi:MAG: hypothetical protein AMXMBFR26_06890 [Porticoccaceae bacterium]
MGVLSGGSARAGRVASVADLPMCAVPSASLYAKDGPVVANAASADAFFTAVGLANMGAAGRLVAAGAWLRVVNVAGRGVLSALVLAESTAFGEVLSVRVVVDGIARELNVSDVPGSRVVVGALVPGDAATNWDAGSAPVSGPIARGFDSAGKAGLLTMHSGTLPTAADALAMGLPVVEFFGSLVVEFKRSAAPVPDVKDRVAVVYGSLPAWA